MKSEVRKVVIGAGPYHNNPGWIHTQEEELHLLDESTWKERFEEGSLSAVLAEHVWEHLTFSEGVLAAKRCWRYLKEDGYIRCAVPDGNFKNKEYQQIVQVGGPGPVDHPAATHKFVHTHKTIKRMFELAGFDVVLVEYCDDNGRFNMSKWDGEKGKIFRSKKYDPRNQGESLVFPSLIVDAIKRKKDIKTRELKR
ncbi:class I SAM-dependent methyltransferase [Bacillus weihaiensis]|uniref:Protein distantly related to SAM-dependent methyltransferase n=1 Tax=Bacillus weihaiensis TaxID=1547283 RepID=A0A1L3MRE5_9BACI|nr:methyltransferase domain-containing protein [Bacillus weihaiensis]APH04939.1 protein distantly related to SAM-dependent methyltransferase [Bacillus weihaiensis]